MYKSFFLIFICLNIYLYGNTFTVNSDSQYVNILPHSEVYIDKSRKLSIDDIKNKSITFTQTDTLSLNYGYSPDFDVWVKITLKNDSDKKIQKILEYNNPLTTNIEFYDSKSNKMTKEGWLHLSKDRSSVNPIFHITLDPYETNTYYLKLSSYITTLVVKLNLWDEKEFIGKEHQHQYILGLFFGGMIILAIYNLFIFLFTKDISYFYYIIYLAGVTFHQFLYTGVFHLYIFSPEFRGLILSLTPIAPVIPFLALALFMKTFLNMKPYKILDKVLNILILLAIFHPLYIIVFQDWTFMRNAAAMTLILYLVSITIYFVFKKNRQAYFIFAGWTTVLLSGFIMYLSSIGLFELKDSVVEFQYIVELGFIIEAIIFSIALADRINTLQKSKIESDRKYILLQHNEKEKLESLVDKKTIGLKQALDEKNILMKELNHRVKNNLQMIIYLLKLQSKNIDDDKVKNIFLTVQNRINAMSKLHELLYKQENLSYIKTKEYFSLLIKELKVSYQQNVTFKVDISTDLNLNQAIYCGLIFNELVSNSLKYAFNQKYGVISVSLHKKDNTYLLNISDDGLGFNKENKKDSLGLLLVDTLAKKQLKGHIDILTNKGVSVSIKWMEHE